MEEEEEKDLGGVLDVTVAISEWILPEEAAEMILKRESLSGLVTN